MLSKCFDVNALNVERKKLENACVVTIYVQECIYLSAKWKSQNVNLSHVRIVRTVPG